MKVGIVAQRLLRTKKHGMDIVALELIKNLQCIDKSNEYIIFVAPGDDKACIKESANFKVVELNGLMYPFWEQLFMPMKAKAMGCDLIHCTANTGPIFTKVPMIATVHDIIYLSKSTELWRRKGSWYQILGNVYRRMVVPMVLSKSKCIVTVSNSEKNKILDSVSFLNKVKVIYNGVGEYFMRITNQEILQSAVSKFKLPEKYFVFHGNTAPKKNTKNVLIAFAKFCEDTNHDHKLVLLDYSRSNLLKILQQIDHVDIFDRIHLLGYVLNTDLPAILSLSDGFLYPSLYESFGIPILEGMACEVPVITSNTSSMPEIAGGAAVLVDPNEPQEIAEAMKIIVENANYRNELCRRGRERVKFFSWKEMAKNYLRIYNEVYEKLKHQT